MLSHKQQAALTPVRPITIQLQQLMMDLVKIIHNAQKTPASHFMSGMQLLVLVMKRLWISFVKTTTLVLMSM